MGIVSDVDNMVNFYKSLNEVLDTNVFDANITAAAQNQDLDVVSELFAVDETGVIESLGENVHAEAGTDDIEELFNVDNVFAPKVEIPVDFTQFDNATTIADLDLTIADYINLDMGDAMQNMAETFDMSGVTDALQEGVQNIFENVTL